jgi:[protein-PII] uridylyltransferase
MSRLLGDREQFAVVAVGGYGRRELAPASDLDIVLVHNRARDVSAVADSLWYPIWDAGFRLDHSVRTVREALALADGDLKVSLGLLDARCVAGNRALGDELCRRAQEQWERRARRMLTALRQSVRDRHDEFGTVAFGLEPDLKEGNGGLRDVSVLHALTAGTPVVEPAPSAHVAAAALFDVRVALQRVSGRRDNRLLLEEQDDVARAVERRDADALMGDVAAAARTVSWLLEGAWRAVDGWMQGPTGRSRSRADVPLGDGLVLREGEVTASADADVTGDASLLPRAADAAARYAAPFASSTLTRLAAEAPVLDDQWPTAARDALVGMLGTGDALIPVFETLDQYELLTRVLPEWSAVRSRPQRNAFHRFTVDRHLVECAVRASSCTRRVARPDLLLVGAWLHDLGKGFPGDHTETGVELMCSIGKRMGFEPADVDLLAGMVRHHLLLPSVATSRDLGDPATAMFVAEAVGSPELLELLDALTEADSLATGETAWTPWKAELVHRLVEQVAAVLAGRPPDPMLEDGSDEDAQLVERAAGGVLVDGADDHLLVLAPDEPRLFSRVVGVLGLHGQDVRAASARSPAPGVALSEFDIVGAFGSPPDWDRFGADLRAALRGRLAMDARLRERAERYERLRRPTAAQPPASRVVLDDRASAATIVEVRTADGIGVLYRITRALADLHLDICHAKVSTMGHEVVDTFYVVGDDGEKVEADHLAEVERAVLDALR